MHHNIININPSYTTHLLNLQIAKQCAPLLTGIKISNLLITQCVNLIKVYQIYENTSIKIKFLCRQKERVTLLLYQEKELYEYLLGPKAAELMFELGYEEIELVSILKLFAERYAGYMKRGGTFPHEMGILLGYPIADVAGFIEHEGKNFLYSGYWKVYGDLYQALDTFEQYKRVKELTVQQILTGMSIQGILKLNQEDTQLNVHTQILQLG